ncbi:MAG: hypothetical protein DWH91_05360 [Planctomycetota bacterium]|nr:MAG: hypothetical protein DWH91_05360 [Planctomycetota bacterium]
MLRFLMNLFVLMAPLLSVVQGSFSLVYVLSMCLMRQKFQKNAKPVDSVKIEGNGLSVHDGTVRQ